ncbi:ABC transporter permease [Methanosphaerula palustris]|uniref:ABC transporter permease n=1 Tax=Methanosphaerula palustris TaxID=475088 RepID=UPI00191C3E63|nr:ABC transporter permease [Methanosphaerula palustris]
MSGQANHKIDLAKIGRLLSSGIALLIVIGLWEILPRAGIINAAFLPPFSVVLTTLIGMTLSGEIFTHLFISLERSILGFGLAVLIAIPLGLALGWYPKFFRLLNPLIETLRNIPTLALYPVLILFLGIGEVSKVAIIFYAALWKVLINTISGVESVDPLLVKAARSVGVTSDLEIFKKVIFPSAVPQIASGMRLGATSAILVLVAAEMMGAKSGLGFLVTNSQYNFEIEKMYAAIICLVILGLASNYLLVWFEKRATRWKEEINGNRKD